MINRLSKNKSRKPASKSATAARRSPVAASKAKSVASKTEQMRAGDLPARSAAVQDLRSPGDRQTTSALVAALRDLSADVARDAAVALGALRDATAVDHLTIVVVNADGFFHSSVRIAAAEALAKLQDQRAVDVLIRTTGDQIAEVSQAAIRALGLLGNERAIDALVTVVQNDHNYYLASVRQTAVEALSRLAVPSARESLRKIAADGHLESSIRQAALALVNSAN